MEVRRGSWSPESSHANLRPYLRYKLNTRPLRERLYLAHYACHQAVTRKRASRMPYRMEYDGLVANLLSTFRSGWTPEEIAGRLPIDFPGNPRMRLSVETLYSCVYSTRTRSRALWQYLPRGIRNAGYAAAGVFITVVLVGALVSTTDPVRSLLVTLLAIGNQTVQSAQNDPVVYTPQSREHPGTCKSEKFTRFPSQTL